MKKFKIIFTLLALPFLLSLTPVKVSGEEDILSNNDEILLENTEISLSNDIDILANNTDNTISQNPEITAPAPLLPQPVSTGVPTLIVVHRISNICVVYDKYGQVVNSFIVSTGRKGHNTPLGTYRIYEHSTGSGYHLMVDGTYGRWCMRFKQGGYMFHSVCYARVGDAYPIAQEVADLGTSVSRGCVRLSVSDAEWLYRATPNGCTVRIVND